MEEYLAVCRKSAEKKIDNYYQITYDDLEITLPAELAGSDVSVEVNPWPSDLPNRELLVVIA